MKKCDGNAHLNFNFGRNPCSVAQTIEKNKPLEIIRSSISLHLIR